MSIRTPRVSGAALPDIVAPVPRRADIRDLGRMPASAPMSVVVTTAYQHAAELQSLIELQGNPRSPLFHHFLTPAQFANYFAISPADYQRTQLALVRAGFRITGGTSNRTIIDVVAPASTVERYFGTEMHHVMQTGGGLRFANARPASLPVELRGLVSSATLDNLIVAHPNFVLGPGAGRRIVDARTVAVRQALAAGRHPDQTCFIICFGPSPTPKPTATPTPRPTATPTPRPTGTPVPTPTPTAVPTPTPSASASATPVPTPTPSPTPSGSCSTAIGGPLRGGDNGLGPIAVANGYDLPVQHCYNGQGHATGVAISGDYGDADLATYLAYFGITRTGPTTVRVEVDGGATYNSSFSTSNASVEAALDVETIVGNAPGTALYMYLFPDLSSQHIEDGYSRADSDGIVDVLNSSFGGCETSDTSFTNTTETLAQQGAAVGITYSASSGDSGSKECGTSLFGFGGSTGVSSPASAPHIVAVGGTTFNVGTNGAYSSETAWSGSGGGVSTVFAEPSYQSGVGGTAKTTGRNVPDVAFAADPNTGTALYFGGAWNGPIGGTSWSSPINSALQTEVNQRDGAKAGFVNPRIYSAYHANGYAIFHDITSGNNGSFSAGTGYDNVTGIGSARGFAFAAKE